MAVGNKPIIFQIRTDGHGMAVLCVVGVGMDGANMIGQLNA